MTEHLIPDPLKVGRKVLASTHRTALQTGIYMGAALIVVMIAALFVANRVAGHRALRSRTQRHLLRAIFYLHADSDRPLF